MLLQRAEYDAKTKRAYVEFRARDGDAVATTIFSYRTTERLSKGQLREEVVRMARHLLKRADAATEYLAQLGLRLADSNSAVATQGTA